MTLSKQDAAADIADKAALFDPLSITTAAGDDAADVGGADILTGLMLREEAAEASALLITLLLPVAAVFVKAPTSKVKTTPA